MKINMTVIKEILAGLLVVFLCGSIFGCASRSTPNYTAKWTPRPIPLWAQAAPRSEIVAINKTASESDAAAAGIVFRSAK